MKRFWNSVIEPVLVEIKAKNIVEIGSQAGLNTKNLLEFCRESGGCLHAIDPFPLFDVPQWQQEYGDTLVIHKELSLSALPLIKDYDAILIDGDHNWYTVYNELKIIEKTFEGTGKFPVVFVHDIGWPYGRRDLYYNPDNIPLAYQQPYKKMGISPNTSSLQEGGMNQHLHNAIYENNPQNGVLTAIEDFLKGTEVPLSIKRIEGFNGIGAIIPYTVNYQKINSFLDGSATGLQIMRELEKDRLGKHIEIDELKRNIKRKEENIKELKSSLEIEEQKYVALREESIKEFQSSLEFEEQRYLLLRGEFEEKEKKHENVISQLEEQHKAELIRIKEEILTENEKSQRLELSLQESFKNIEALKKSLKETFIKLQKAEIAVSVQLNSVRYRLGHILISAIRPSKDTLLAPIRLAKLFFQGLQKVKARRLKKKLVTLLENPVNNGNGVALKVEPPFKEDNLRLIQTKLADIIAKHNSYDFKHPNECPMVSVLILNRNGNHHLARLFKAIRERSSEYPNYEIIVVDNNSTDNSIEVIKSFSMLPIRVIQNKHNASFSEANNQAAREAKGEYLLLLNNDVEPLKGWLSEMVTLMLSMPDIGTVGSKLIYSIQDKKSMNKSLELKIQHTGIAFRQEEDFIQPYNIGKGLNPFDPTTDIASERAAVTAASLLVKKDLYTKVGGLDEGYIYGYEDVDFGLKMISNGYKNMYCPTSVIIHYEFGTQQEDNRTDIRDRRINNRKLLKAKWYRWLTRNMIKNMIENSKVLSEKPLKVALVVTDCGPDVTAGDYFTALELGEGMKKLGWKVDFLARRGKKSWYDVEEDTDVVISLLDAYNPTKIKNDNPNLIKIAWMRNWFDKWADSAGFENYDILLASSKIACNLIKEQTGREASLLQIGTNATRFDLGKFEQDYSCDYCFTGSYWNDPREIIDMLNPSRIPYKFNLYGENWEQVSKLRPYHKGFLKYNEIPNLYKSTRIVIDDANRVTKPYGSVNSRVFDALVSGALVVTNGFLGAQETFNGELPVYSNSEELEDLLNYYLANENERLEKVEKLKNIVLNNHTYDRRAIEMKNILSTNRGRYRIAIKIPAPKWETVHEWGDYHMALGLKREFELKGHSVIFQLLYEWDNGDDSTCDVVIVLRGLNAYKPKPHHINILWNISHPDKVSIKEYEEYNYVFISSINWAKEINLKTEVMVEPMLQCTDPNLFRVPDSTEHRHQLLFVGNSRKIYRKIVKDLVPTNKELAVYGTLWESLIDKKYIKGQHIPNTEVYKYYGSCDILLNDHWDDMREKGFISNRIFDGLASGAFIITDKVAGIEEVLGDGVVTYDTPDELNQLVDFYLKNPDQRIEKAQKGAEIVRRNHTYTQRAEKFLEVIEQFCK